MKNIKLLYILSVLLIIVTGTMCTSCTAEDDPQTVQLNQINNVPDQLEGFYISPNYPDSTIDIKEDSMVLKFNPYIEKTIEFSMEDMRSTATNKSFTVHYYEGVDIIFEYIVESGDITVVYNDNGVVMQFGQFTKQ